MKTLRGKPTFASYEADVPKSRLALRVSHPTCPRSAYPPSEGRRRYNCEWRRCPEKWRAAPTGGMKHEARYREVLSNLVDVDGNDILASWCGPRILRFRADTSAIID